MTPRERFKNAASRQKVDRAPFDLCGNPQTRIDSPETRDALCELYGFSPPKRGRFSIDERILERFGIDTRLVGGMPTPKTVHNGERDGVIYDSYGIGRRMADDRYEICHYPLRGADIDEALAYPMPEADDIDLRQIKAWAEEAEYLHNNTDYAIIAEHPVLGILELGCWMFGYEDFLYRLAAEPELVNAFFGRVLSYQKKVVDIYYGALGRHIDCTTSGDDFGMQTGPMLSAGMFDGLIKPFLKERIAHTKKYTDAFYQHHTCGSVYALIPSLAESGVDIVNPIQPGTYMMEPERLKKDYGSIISFWGGVDTQDLLPNGSEEDVRNAVGALLKIMGADGGYILAPAHCIQKDVPARNVAAIYEGADDFYKGDTKK